METLKKHEEMENLKLQEITKDSIAKSNQFENALELTQQQMALLQSRNGLLEEGLLQVNSEKEELLSKYESKAQQQVTVERLMGQYRNERDENKIELEKVERMLLEVTDKSAATNIEYTELKNQIRHLQSEHNQVVVSRNQLLETQAKYQKEQHDGLEQTKRDVQHIEFSWSNEKKKMIEEHEMNVKKIVESTTKQVTEEVTRNVTEKVTTIVTDLVTTNVTESVTLSLTEERIREQEKDEQDRLEEDEMNDAIRKELEEQYEALLEQMNELSQEHSKNIENKDQELQVQQENREALKKEILQLQNELMLLKKEHEEYSKSEETKSVAFQKRLETVAAQSETSKLELLASINALKKAHGKEMEAAESMFQRRTIEMKEEHEVDYISKKKLWEERINKVMVSIEKEQEEKLRTMEIHLKKQHESAMATVRYVSVC